MAKSSRRKVGRIKKDRISALPQNIQETILCFLPIEDAVRTSVLSMKWRYCWTMIPDLVFDAEFVESLMDKLHKCRDPDLKAFKLVSVINKILLFHNGPILKFSLDFPDNCNAKIIHDYIHQWIPLFSRKGLKQLIIWDRELEEIRAHPFSSLDLNHLRLSSIWFPYTPTFGRFTYLTNLELVNATRNFGESIFDCPVLEKLTLIICEGLFHTNFRAPNLKCLHQVYSDITSEYTVDGLENLTEYSFVLENEPETQTEISNVLKVLSGLHSIEKFSIAKRFLTYLAAGGSANRLPKPIPYLKTLNISEMNFTDISEVSCLLCLIRSAPNLCKLNISGDSNFLEEGGLEEYWIEDSEDCTLNHLQIITFSYFSGFRAELELVKFLVAHSPMLKTMSIHRDPSIKKDVALTMAEEMLQYSRASSRAQIRHLKKPVEIDEFDIDLWADYYINIDE